MAAVKWVEFREISLRVLTFLLLVTVINCEIPPAYSNINIAANEYPLPNLRYEYIDLEPYIDSKTVDSHHSGHHAAYTAKMNTALNAWRNEDPSNNLAKGSILHILMNLDHIPAKYRQTLKNQGGGYINHCFYWAGMSPNLTGKRRQPTGNLLQEITTAFGSYEKFVEMFNEKAKGLFGSGYVWLARREGEYNGKTTNLAIAVTANQDSPVSSKMRPLLVLDVWEHAYYLKHHFRRASHIDDWWMVVDWDNVAELDLWWLEWDARHRVEL